MRKKDHILGESRTCRVTLNVTPTMAKKLRALVHITGKSVTDLVQAALEPVLTENAERIDAVVAASNNFDAAVANAKNVTQGTWDFATGKVLFTGSNDSEN